MQQSRLIFNLDRFIGEDELFICGIEGELRMNLIREALYNFLPYPFYDYTLPPTYTAYIKCILAVTNKRILIIGKTLEDGIDEKHVYSFNYKDIDFHYRKRLGARMFTISSEKLVLFGSTQRSVVFKVEGKYSKEADRIKNIIQEYKA